MSETQAIKFTDNLTLHTGDERGGSWIEGYVWAMCPETDWKVDTRIESDNDMYMIDTLIHKQSVGATAPVEYLTEYTIDDAIATARRRTRKIANNIHDYVDE